MIKIYTDKDEFLFDHVVFAVHPENIFKILEKPFMPDISFLENFKIEENVCYLHSDNFLMP